MSSVATQTYAKYQDSDVPNGDIAQAAKEIASLNATISRATVVGDVPNDLLDRRDQLLDQLSGSARSRSPTRATATSTSRSWTRSRRHELRHRQGRRSLDRRARLLVARRPARRLLAAGDPPRAR